MGRENVMEVKFYDTVNDELLKFAVIISQSNGKWVFCKHKERDTYEVPGGHREAGEDIFETAKRELQEETGAIKFEIKPICVYSVTGKTTNPYLQSICHLLRPFIYIGLYLVWAISFQKRIIQKEPRRCLIMIAVMMVFWMLVRMCKFEIPYEMPTALRYAWYLYYIPMLLLPTVSLYLAFYIRQPENYKLPERRCLLFFPALFLIGIVLTNDLHQLVFTFPEGRLGEAASYEVGVYGYGAMYYAIVAWDLGCLLVALLIILLRCRKIKNRKMLWME